MKNFFWLDYLGCILFKTIGPVLRILPVEVSFFLGRRLGDCLYYFDLKHKARAYVNIKAAMGGSLSPLVLSKLTREFYQSFGQSIIEVFLIPLVDKKYMDKYIEIEGEENVWEAFKNSKGVILASVHAGSWEFSNIICARLGFPFAVFVKDQRLPRLNQLLNSYRENKGCKIITRAGGLRELVGSLKNNQAIGITVDQGGRMGILVDFFGRPASMPTGAIKLALKYDAALIPVFFTRVRGPKIKIWVGKQLTVSRTDDEEQDIRDNLRKAVSFFEGFIRKYPREYLWTYKIFKYSGQREIVILSDGKAGHLRQSEAVAKIARGLLSTKDIIAKINVVEVKFKSKPARFFFNICVTLSGKYHCQGCLGCLKKFLTEDTYRILASLKPDIIISAGSSVAGVNFVLSRENLSVSVAILRPSILSTHRFNLVIMPRHDRPLRRKNLLAIEGALNLIDEKYLAEESARLISFKGLNKQGLYIGLLIGGESKKFSLSPKFMLDVAREVKSLADKIDAGILITTSRRTSLEVEAMIKREFKDYPRLKVLIIANEENIPTAIGGILGLSSIIISSPESISMISEAVNSKKYVFVFKAPGLSIKHQRFLRYFVKKKYIYLTESANLSKTVEAVWRAKPAAHSLRDNYLVSEALEKIL
ncbi:MAG: hypothetical protein COT38_02650 [Candidatus Omnitrophica bacterium CG08_land_8_20_14_0_20_41_16]|uniref:Uncharacterized protein n=1 Tax=Candidatus Sherwoodlollariibacterium unditelluris TaxID=1974757 RepID=A0A2G9YL00_9BACT|nr:MAG: hypothetical protein COX41_00210 [Candidatus Omnitrophica bacterium CG23_combo_of_CG06-09_8_20_14_all_41_10]PIS33925.1 MAG: hypothetical protein COT38_02650 [Candidatus Omnitrophica bacterium CG08_land_8_20_14_0_20_41_16]